MNEDIVRMAIMKKNSYDRPYYATNRTAKQVVTDFDDFPYNRWYRGVATNPNPVIIEREAGYRYVEKNCYIDKPEYTITYPKHCFEAPCSTVYPCTPEAFKKFTDQDAMNIMLNRACVLKSP
jgi:hypothetical protein